MVSRTKLLFFIVWIVVIIFLFFLIGPFIPLVVWSVTKYWPWPQLLPETITLDSWKYLFSSSGRAVDGIMTSMIVALLTLMINILIGTPAAIGLAQKKFRGHAVVFLLLLSPLFIPTTVSIMGMYKLAFYLDSLNSYFRVAVAHVVITLPYFIVALWYQFRLIGKHLQEAAISLGASRWQTFLWVEFPQIVPSFSLASILVVIISFSQYLPTWIMSGGTLLTLPLIMFPFAESGDASLVSAYSLIFFIPIIVSLLIYYSFLRWYTEKFKIE